MFTVTPPEVSQVANTIQLAVAPIFLLAGVGAFLNVCAGRLSRIVDRARQLEPRILAWNETNYTYLKQQSSRNSGIWVSIDDDRNLAVGSVK